MQSIKWLQWSLCLFFCVQSAVVLAQKTLPTYSFEDLNGEMVQLDQIPYKKYLSIVLYDPGCDHCQHEAESIAKSFRKFKKTRFVWITINTPATMREFRDKYFTPQMSKDMVFLYDKQMLILKKFDDFIETPTVLIYDKHKKLVAAPVKAAAPDIYKYYR